MHKHLYCWQKQLKEVGLPGGDAQAKTYYENAIAADMAVYSLYPGTTPISAAEITAYINDPAVCIQPNRCT